MNQICLRRAGGRVGDKAGWALPGGWGIDGVSPCIDDCMSDHALDNPIYESLITRHRDLALRQGDALRYPAPIAPFLGVAQQGASMAAALADLVPIGDTALLLGRAPSVGSGWELRHLADLAQMICDEPVVAADASDIIELGAAHRDDVLALTALVYPHYFRPRTMELGRYFGIYQDGRLAAMAGERMGTHECTELSAICTHPDFLGRGYAR